jgi:hypothetical protein
MNVIMWLSTVYCNNTVMSKIRCFKTLPLIFPEIRSVAQQSPSFRTVRSSEV